MPIVHVQTIYRKDRIDWPNLWKSDKQSWCSNLVEEEDGSKCIKGISILKNDILIVKKRFSAFFNTNLDDVLKNLDVRNYILLGTQPMFV